MQKHQGKLRVRSRTDMERHGTCCGVFLPFAASEPAAADDDALSPGMEHTTANVLTKSATESGDDRSAA